jgi:hypothetical protein
VEKTQCASAVEIAHETSMWKKRDVLLLWKSRRKDFYEVETVFYSHARVFMSLLHIEYSVFSSAR